MNILMVTMLAVVAATETNVADLLQRSNHQFTQNMFAEVTKANPGKSVVLSGFSVLTPLAQLSLASEGASHDELLRAMSLPNDNATIEVFRFVNRDIRAIKGVTLDMASRVYISEGYELNENFQRVSRDLFRSDVRNVDFTKNEATAAEINHWVEDHTNKHIKDLVDPESLDAYTRAVLVNAVYFKGTWADKFNNNLTRDRDFHVSKEKTIRVPTMEKYGGCEMTYSKELDAKLLKFPYAGEEAFMLIVLPNKIDGLPTLEEKLKDPEALSKAIEKMYPVWIDLYFPKFKIETTTDLKNVLQNIGVKGIFNPTTAKLNRMLKGEENSLYVSEAVQKAFIEVSEDGTEAGVANEFVERIVSGPPQIRVDHPFWFAIVSGNNTLFTGIYQG